MLTTNQRDIIALYLSHLALRTDGKNLDLNEFLESYARYRSIVEKVDMEEEDALGECE